MLSVAFYRLFQKVNYAVVIALLSLHINLAAIYSFEQVGVFIDKTKHLYFDDLFTQA